MNVVAWNTLVRDLQQVDDLDVMVDAAKQLHRKSSLEDLPRLKELLKDESFFVREAAAWPLSELAGSAALPEHFDAFQRGFDEGHDNDGFSTALIEMAAADREGTRRILAVLVNSENAATRENAQWLLEFCKDERDVWQCGRAVREDLAGVRRGRARNCRARGAYLRPTAARSMRTLGR